MNTVTRAIELKKSGLTIRQTVNQLISEGRTMPNGKPVTYHYIRKWVKGISPQNGIRRSKKNEAEIAKLKDDSIKLKENGLTTKEVLAKLISEGRTMPNGKPITYYYVYKWVKGINPQGGYRRPSMKGMTKEEREKYCAEWPARRRAYQQQWRKDNREHINAMNRRWYQENKIALTRRLDDMHKFDNPRRKFGYNYVEGELIPNKAEQKIVRLVTFLLESDTDEYDYNTSVFQLNELCILGEVKFTKSMLDKLYFTRKSSETGHIHFTKKSLLEIAGRIAYYNHYGEIWLKDGHGNLVQK